MSMNPSEATSVYNFQVEDIKHQKVDLETFKGKVLLIVNIATKCGFTPQLGDLEELYKDYKDKGLVILGFPCNQFANQSPQDDEGIQSFCQRSYNITFPIFAKVEVNGDNASPLFDYIKSQKKNLGLKRVKWNFEKFLVDQQGQVVDRFLSMTSVSSIRSEIDKLLNKN